MAVIYAYQGLDSGGTRVKGEVTAEDSTAAALQLKARGLFPTEIKPREAGAGSVPAASGWSGWRNRRRLAGDLSIMTRQLANLVAGGVPLMTAFVALSEHTENPLLRRILEQRQEEVRGGKALWEALASSPEIFPPLYVNMVKAGEASGQLASVLTWLADYQEQEQARRLQIRSALPYPILLVVTGTAAIILMITFVVPRFSAMYAEFNQVLPLATVILLGVAHGFARWGWLLALGVTTAVLSLRAYGRTPAGRLWTDRWRLRLPLFGKLQLKTIMSRFARTTATLMQGGVPLLEALTVVREVLGNEALAQATDRAREGMREGERFASRLAETGLFPKFLTYMIGIGEETGDLRSMLLTVADTYEVEANASLKGLISILEPVIIISVGTVMGFIILSMLLPIFQLNVLGD